MCSNKAAKRCSILVEPTLNTKSENEMVIYERELLTYAKTKSISKIFAVMREPQDKPVWELEFLLKGATERALLVTSLNKPRVFPRLDTMIALVQLWCPEIDELVLDLNCKTSH